MTLCSTAFFLVSVSASRTGADKDPLVSLATTAEVISGRPLASSALDQFRSYLDLLITWNRVQRLTGLDSPKAIVRGLFEDSLLFLPLFPSRRARVLDLGAGAGFPGLPLKIVEPAIALTLIESKRKRVSFLRTVSRTLGLNDVVMIEGRAELVIRNQPGLTGAFDTVVTRAVGPVSDLMAVVQPYLKPDGLFIASGSPLRDTTRQLPAGVTAQIVDYPELGLRRKFLIARRA